MEGGADVYFVWHSDMQFWVERSHGEGEVEGVGDVWISHSVV